MTTLIQFANKLRKEFPCNIPIKVKTCIMPISNTETGDREFGDAIDYGTHYLIRINKEDPLSVQKDTLIHELAHCLAGWDDNSNTHSEKWGIIYAKIYSFVFK
jgi:Zn-dependent peptidase ImmA (M78 family)